MEEVLEIKGLLVLGGADDAEHSPGAGLGQSELLFFCEAVVGGSDISAVVGYLGADGGGSAGFLFLLLCLLLSLLVFDGSSKEAAAQEVAAVEVDGGLFFLFIRVVAHGGQSQKGRSAVWGRRSKSALGA